MRLGLFMFLSHVKFILCCRFFTAIWAIFRPLIDEVTRQKFFILGSDYLSVLRNHIDDSQIPSELGGTAENFVWSWPYPDGTGCSPSEIAEFVEYRKSILLPSHENNNTITDNASGEGSETKTT
jgi:hypothetical protein